MYITYPTPKPDPFADGDDDESAYHTPAAYSDDGGDLAATILAEWLTPLSVSLPPLNPPTPPRPSEAPFCAEQGRLANSSPNTPR